MVASVPNLNMGFKIFSYFVASPQYLLSVESVETLNHFSIFADLGFFRLWFQEFRKTNSGIQGKESKEAGDEDKLESLRKEKFFKDKKFKIVKNNW